MAYYDDIQDDMNRSGSRSIGESQMQQGQSNGTFMLNLGKFFMYAGTGMAQGIGTGLANTDLNNPFKGAGMANLGGLGMATNASQTQSALDTEQAQMPWAIEKQKTASALRLDEYQAKLNKDLENTKSILKTYKPSKSTSERRTEEEMEDRGELNIGASYLSPAGKVFRAQQGLAASRAAQTLFGVNSGMRNA